MVRYENKKPEDSAPSASVLLELCASDDLAGFKAAMEAGSLDIDEIGLWYGGRIGSRTMGYEERTPLMIAATFGSKQVLAYIISKGVDVNKASASDGATALHCAAVGGSASSHEIAKLLLDAYADVNLVDANGNRPGELIDQCGTCFRPAKNMLELMLNESTSFEAAHELVDAQIGGQALMSVASKDEAEKKEYPVDPSLPDIRNGIYGTDEFRMYTFKVRPCSRAYSHDWTECPFLHPGENARRRDPRKYQYSCVPCPDFKKGACQRGDDCEYAHGIFECWLHPAQYRTRMCKDEEKCGRRVCFFAHKSEELRPSYASTGSAMLSPRSFSASPYDIGSMSPHILPSPAVVMSLTSTPPLTPTPSPIGSTLWPNQPNVAPPTLQLPSSRLRSAINARDFVLRAEMLKLEDHHLQQEQILLDDVSLLSSPSVADQTGDFGRHVAVRNSNLSDLLGSPEPSIFSQLEELRLSTGSSQIHSAERTKIQQNLHEQLRASYTSSHSPSSFGMDASGSASSVLTSRSAAFAKRSHSFIDRSAANRLSGAWLQPPAASMLPPSLSEWGSPDGKLDWGFRREELNKLRRSASLGCRSNGKTLVTSQGTSVLDQPANEPDVSWVQSLVKDGSSSWVDNLYSEQQERIVA